MARRPLGRMAACEIRPPAPTVGENECPRQPNATELITLRLVERLATKTITSPFKRPFPADILLTTHTSVWFSDVQRLSTSEADDYSIYGALISSKPRNGMGNSRHGPVLVSPRRVALTGPNQRRIYRHPFRVRTVRLFRARSRGLAAPGKPSRPKPHRIKLPAVNYV